MTLFILAGGMGSRYGGLKQIDPFTENGEFIIDFSIYDAIQAGFDRVVFLIKEENYEALAPEAIELTLKELGLTNVYIDIFDGLIAKYAKANGIRYMIRGLRNNMDYNYEENIAEVNKLINPEMEYIYFRAENVAVSSSMVKELRNYDQDVSMYVPRAVFEIL